MAEEQIHDNPLRDVVKALIEEYTKPLEERVRNLEALLPPAKAEASEDNKDEKSYVNTPGMGACQARMYDQ